jgi:hypothetical protein
MCLDFEDPFFGRSGAQSHSSTSHTSTVSVNSKGSALKGLFGSGVGAPGPSKRAGGGGGGGGKGDGRGEGRKPPKPIEGMTADAQRALERVRVVSTLRSAVRTNRATPFGV